MRHLGTSLRLGIALVVALLAAVPLAQAGRSPCRLPPTWVPTVRSGDAAFSHGERIARVCGGDLGGIVAHAEAVEPGLRRQFYDGAGQALRGLPPDAAEAVARLDALVPAQHRAALKRGALVGYTRQARGEPEQVLPFAQGWAQATGGDAIDGVRVGLQRARGADLDDALALAARFPGDWQAPLTEELGWRAGFDGLPVERMRVLRDRAPQPCAFVHGVLRGSTSAEPYAALADGCESMAARGLAWNLANTGGAVEGLDLEPVARVQVEQALLALRTAGGVERVRPWDDAL